MFGVWYLMFLSLQIYIHVIIYPAALLLASFVPVRTGLINFRYSARESGFGIPWMAVPMEESLAIHRSP